MDNRAAGNAAARRAIAPTTRSMGSPKLSRRWVVIRTRFSSSAGSRRFSISRSASTIVLPVRKIFSPGMFSAARASAARRVGAKWRRRRRPRPRFISSGNGCADRRCAGPPRRVRRGARIKSGERPPPRWSCRPGPGPSRGAPRARARRRRTPRRRLRGRLARPHEVQVDVGVEAEEVQHLVEHVAVLRGRAELRLEPLRLRAQPEQDGSHLDRLGAGPRNDEDLHGHGAGNRAGVRSTSYTLASTSIARSVRVARGIMYNIDLTLSVSPAPEPGGRFRRGV